MTPRPRPDSAPLHSSLPILLALFFLLGLGTSSAEAHELEAMHALLLVRADGAFLVDLDVDLDALALGAGSETDATDLAERLRTLDPAERDALVERLAETFERRVRVFADGERVPFTVAFPRRSSEPVGLGRVARLEGRLPAGTETVALRASRAFPPVALVVLQEAAAETLRVEQGTTSAPIPIVVRTESPGHSHEHGHGHEH